MARLKKILIPVLMLALLSGCPNPATDGTQEPKNHPVIIPLLGFKYEINAVTQDNSIPWLETEKKYDVKTKGVLKEELPLVSTVKGNWTYSIYEFMYQVDDVLNEHTEDKELTFLIERKSPAPGSPVRMKELWPFEQNKPLTFKLRKEDEGWFIVSIEPVP